MILNICKERIKENISKNKSVVFDNTNTRFKNREEIRNIARLIGIPTKVIFLDTPIEVQKERQIKNLSTNKRHNVKQEYLDQAVAELEIPTETENVIVFKPEDNIEIFLQKL